VLLVSTLLAGCDAPGFTSKPKTPAQASQQPTGEAATTSAGVGPQDTSATPLQTPAIYTSNLTVSDVIAEACGIQPQQGMTTKPPKPGETRGVAPSFDFDSAALAESDRKMLGDVAKCLTEGPLKGKSITLIGRADPRGEAEYNMTLGESRANTVHRYLVDLGVSRDRARPTSRGEMDATGTNEEGWARDRRVDIELAL
jgi:peptidoglycan-associated lipoprotein